MSKKREVRNCNKGVTSVNRLNQEVETKLKSTRDFALESQEAGASGMGAEKFYPFENYTIKTELTAKERLSLNYCMKILLFN